jgi:hypothetical protein
VEQDQQLEGVIQSQFPSLLGEGDLYPCLKPNNEKSMISINNLPSTRTVFENLTQQSIHLTDSTHRGQTAIRTDGRARVVV